MGYADRGAAGAPTRRRTQRERGPVASRLAAGADACLCPLPLFLPNCSRSHHCKHCCCRAGAPPTSLASSSARPLYARMHGSSGAVVPDSDPSGSDGAAGDRPPAPPGSTTQLQDPRDLRTDLSQRNRENDPIGIGERIRRSLVSRVRCDSLALCISFGPDCVWVPDLGGPARAPRTGPPPPTVRPGLAVRWCVVQVAVVRGPCSVVCTFSGAVELQRLYAFTL